MPIHLLSIDFKLKIHIPYILLIIFSNFRCETLISNTPSRDDGYF